jgi:hypothetical protein
MPEAGANPERVHDMFEVTIGVHGTHKDLLPTEKTQCSIMKSKESKCVFRSCFAQLLRCEAPKWREEVGDEGQVCGRIPARRSRWRQVWRIGLEYEAVSRHFLEQITQADRGVPCGETANSHEASSFHRPVGEPRCSVKRVKHN